MGEMTDLQRARFAELARDQERVLGTKRAAYVRAEVSPTTWARVVDESLSIKAHVVGKVVRGLWPEAQGDWRKIPGMGMSAVPDAPSDFQAQLDDLRERVELLEGAATRLAALDREWDSPSSQD